MKRKKILITGANGYVGSNLQTHLDDLKYVVYSTDLTSSKKAQFWASDISDYAGVFAVIKRSEPDVIIHTAGLSSLGECEKNPKKAYAVNVLGTRNIINAVKKLNPKSKLVFMSSDYVFSGDRGNYKEDDERIPKTVYGKTKVESENDIVGNLENYLIVRSANIYGRGGNFFNFLIGSLESGISNDYFSNLFYTPTPIDYLLKALEFLIARDFKGIIHIAGREKVSRYEFALKAALALGKDRSLIRKSVADDSSLIAKDSSLNTDYAEKIIKSSCPSIEDYMKELFEEI